MKETIKQYSACLLIIYQTKICHLLLCQAQEIKAKVVNAICPAFTY